MLAAFRKPPGKLAFPNPVMSKRLSQLEEYLELQLLQRTTRRLRLTEAGEDFYERSVHILADLDQAMTAVSSVEWGLTGKFRLSCFSSIISTYMADAICEFQGEHPDLTIDLQQHDRLCDPVHEGFDVCLQPGHDKGGVLERTDFFPLCRFLVATPAYIEKHGFPRHPSDLSRHNLAFNDHQDPSGVVNFTHKSNGSKQPIAVSPKMYTNTVWLLRAAVMTNNLIAIMPDHFIERYFAEGRVVPLLTDWEIEPFQFSAFYRRSSFVPMKVRIFINFLKKKFGDTPPWQQRLSQISSDASSRFQSRNTEKESAG